MNLKHTVLVLLFFLSLTLCFARGGKEQNPTSSTPLTTTPQLSDGSAADAARSAADAARSAADAAANAAAAANYAANAAASAAEAKNSTSRGNDLSDPPPQTADARLIPITLEIITDIRKHGGNLLGDLHYYLSNPFAITVVERNDIPERYEVINGTLVVNGGERIETTKIEFDNTSLGTLNQRDDMGTSLENLRIIFQDLEGRNIPLIFRKNPQGNYYDLFSAEINISAGTSTIIRNLSFSDGPPQLCISAQLNERPEALVDSAQGGGQRPIRNDQPPVRDNRGHSYQQDINYSQSNPSNHRSRPIMGRGLLNNPDVVAAYITRNYRTFLSHENVRALIGKYFDEADYEGVNPDIAIAQMLYWTDFLRNRERVSSRNYGGLSPTSTWPGRFGDMTTGVRAHIQHLKGYARPPIRRTQNVDPRYNILRNLHYLGSASTFGQLYEKWSPNNYRYGNSIDGILNELYHLR